jgi:hypothetical protein
MFIFCYSLNFLFGPQILTFRKEKFSILPRTRYVNCSCNTHQSTCTPFCCCDPNCSSSTIKSFPYCLPSTTGEINQFETLCSELDSNVSTLFSWLLRTLLYVQRLQNPSRGDFYIPVEDNQVKNIPSILDSSDYKNYSFIKIVSQSTTS